MSDPIRTTEPAKKQNHSHDLPVCPVCQSPCQSPPRHQYTAEQAANHFCPATRDADRNSRFRSCIFRLWEGGQNAVYQCETCQFGFAWPYVGGDEEFYRIMHEMAGYPARRWDYEIAKQQVLNKLGGGRILDIGTGDGAFLKSLDTKWQAFAIEGSDTMREFLRQRDIRCFDSLPEALNEASGTFNVVTMFQVLEHIAEFDDFLAGCFGLLKPGGMIVIGVPFGEATFFQEDVTGFADMTPNHPNKWSPKALEIALRRAGFDPQSTHFEPGSMKLMVYRAFLRVKARATHHPKSFAATVYRIPKRAMRIPILVALTAASVVRSLPKLRKMSRGHSFAMIAQKPQAPVIGAGGP